MIDFTFAVMNSNQTLIYPLSLSRDVEQKHYLIAIGNSPLNIVFLSRSSSLSLQLLMRGHAGLRMRNVSDASIVRTFHTSQCADTKIPKE